MISHKYHEYHSNQPLQSGEFEVPEEYEIMGVIGRGAYGVVTAAMNENNLCAIKKVMQPFENKVYATRILRELKLLRLLKHDNVLINQMRSQIYRHLQCQKAGNSLRISIWSKSQWKQIFLGCLMSRHSMKNKFNSLYIRYYEVQSTICMYSRYIHSANVIHRDIKPRNLLINENCDLKICDFGLSRLNMVQYLQYQTGYVQTRYYRAPELFLDVQYDQSIDIWSVGCIMAEMIRGKIFLPGSDTKAQIQLIHRVIGNGIHPGISFDKLFPQSSAVAKDLLKKLLEYNPILRITASEALKHPYFKELHNIDDEPICVPIPEIEFEFEKLHFKKEQLKDAIFEEILLYNNTEFKQKYETRRKQKLSLYMHLLKGERQQSDSDD